MMQPVDWLFRPVQRTCRSFNAVMKSASTLALSAGASTLAPTGFQWSWKSGPAPPSVIVRPPSHSGRIANTHFFSRPSFHDIPRRHLKDLGRPD